MKLCHVPEGGVVDIHRRSWRHKALSSITALSHRLRIVRVLLWQVLDKPLHGAFVQPLVEVDDAGAVSRGAHWHLDLDEGRVARGDVVPDGGVALRELERREHVRLGDHDEEGPLQLVELVHEGVVVVGDARGALDQHEHRAATKRRACVC
eukprot:2913718-Pleurochrysis_carterae.AAC.1